MTKQTVILAAGEFPRKNGAAWQLLAQAKDVICCDGAADAYRRHFKKEPTAVVGDGDSVRGRFACVVQITEQDTNDLTKAVSWCRAQGYQHLVLLGATGKREDHTLGNLFRALDLGIEVVTDYGRFIPLDSRATFHVTKGTPISIFATDPTTRMTSRGLEWKLDGVRFENLFCATLNRASAARVVLTTTKRVFVYLAS